jgi:hypothetical protein
LSPRRIARPAAPCRAIDERRRDVRRLSILTWAAALAGVLAAAAPAAAIVCAADAVPGATLLLPYFEVDLDDPNGLTTLFSVNNASATAVLVHAVVWSDLAVPVLSFNVYLTGFDVQTLNLRDLLVHGSLPQTATAGQDPADDKSPKGAYSQDLSFASCAGQLPPPPLSAAELASVQAALTGRPSPLGDHLCAGSDLGDRVARGYVTLDTVNNCTLRNPGDAGYFDGPGVSGDATEQNVLWGTWYIVDAAHDVAEGSNMVAVEASRTDPATAAGHYTFYGRYVGWSGRDHREPLATSFATQFAASGPFSGHVDLIVWRDTKVVQAPFSCSSLPSWYPFFQEAIGIFDEEEHPSSPGFIIPEPLPRVPFPAFPAAAQRTGVGGYTLPVPYSFGWLYVDLNTFRGLSTQIAGPASDPYAAQGWVVSVQSAAGRFATGVEAYRLDSACSPSHAGTALSAY